MYSAPRSHQKSRALTRAARRAQRVQDRPRRRRRSGRSCATERSEGAPVLAQRPAALARSSCKLCEAQRAEHRLWMEAPTSSPLRSRSRLRRRLQSVSCCAVALCERQSSNGSEFKSSHSLTINPPARWLALSCRQRAAGAARTGSGCCDWSPPLPLALALAPQASVGPPLLVRECDDLNSEPSGFPLRADPLEARITPIRTATERQRRSTVSGCPLRAPIRLPLLAVQKKS